MKALVLSDKIVPFLYSPQIQARFRHVDLVVSCGDLAYYYLEYVQNALGVPLYYVRGNHDEVIEYSMEGFQRTHPHGAIDLHGVVARYRGVILAGVEGSLRYRPGKFQYTQAEMWTHVWRLLPRLLVNRMYYGRFLDVFIAHAPPAGVHDQRDHVHQGIKAFRWLIDVFQPSFFFHGHIHVYHPDAAVETTVSKTRVINAYGYREVEIVCGT